MSLAALAAVLVAGRGVLTSAGLAVLDDGADMDPSMGADIALAVAIVEGPADLLAALGQVGVLGGVTTALVALLGLQRALLGLANLALLRGLS